MDDGSKRLVEQGIPTRGEAMAEMQVADQKSTEITHVLAVRRREAVPVQVEVAPLIEIFSTGARARRRHVRTIRAFFLDDVLQHPIECF